MALNMSVQELIQHSPMPVYGISGNLFDLKLTSIGRTSRADDENGTQILTTIMLGFAGKSLTEKSGTAMDNTRHTVKPLGWVTRLLRPKERGRHILSADMSARRRVQGSDELFPSKEHTVTLLHLYSCNNHDSRTRSQVLQMMESHSSSSQRMDTKTLRFFQIDETTQKSLGQPTKLVEHLTIMDQTVTAELHYWDHFPQPAWFLLQNEQTLFYGQALGFTREEIFRIFQQCIVVNDNEQTIQQYQKELDDHLSHLFDIHS